MSQNFAIRPSHNSTPTPREKKAAIEIDGETGKKRIAAKNHKIRKKSIFHFVPFAPFRG